MDADKLAARPELTETLAVAVPMWVVNLRGTDAATRLEIAKRCGDVIAHQGDTLLYGSKGKFGSGGKAKARHDAAPRCHQPDCTCKGAGCTVKGCYCHGAGEPAYSAGEVFNHLARGLACLAYLPGGVTFAGMHWCTADCCTCHDTGIVFVETGCTGCCDLPGGPVHLPECGVEPCPEGCTDDDWAGGWEPPPDGGYRRVEDVIDPEGRL